MGSLQQLPIVAHVRRVFEREFWPVAGKFAFLALAAEEARASDSPLVWRPGVYVWTDGKRVYKVGRHLTNARKRAFEHVQDDTDGQLKAVGEGTNAVLILLTVDSEDRHWAAALGIYLEEKLKPLVRSKREG